MIQNLEPDPSLSEVLNDVGLAAGLPEVSRGTETGAPGLVGGLEPGGIGLSRVRRV